MSSYGPLVFNHARADWRDFKIKPGSANPYSSGGYIPRSQYVHTSNPDKPVCFMSFGSTFNSSVSRVKSMSDGKYMAKTVPLSPICLEWARSFSFLGHVLGFSNMYLYNSDGMVSFTSKIVDSGTLLYLIWW
jgi:hypothetical protein